MTQSERKKIEKRAAKERKRLAKQAAKKVTALYSKEKPDDNKKPK